MFWKRKKPARSAAPPRRPDRQYVYLMWGAGTGLYKIGISDQPERRRRQLANASGLDVRIVSVWEVWNARETERVLHRYFRDVRREGEWFQMEPRHLRDLRQAMGPPLTGT